MKTILRLNTLLKILVLILLVTTTGMAVQAQHGRDRGRGHEYKENRRDYREDRGRRDRDYRPQYRNERSYNDRYYGNERTYMRRAPWGMHRPYMMSHNRGRLYYYRGSYYEYYPNRGYTIVEAPVGYEFDEVPAGFSRVWVDNTWCYRRGDFYLRPSVHGFISFNRPGVSIGANF